jgi:hypothetical protein
VHILVFFISWNPFGQTLVNGLKVTTFLPTLSGPGRKKESIQTDKTQFVKVIFQEYRIRIAINQFISIARNVVNE